MPPLNNRFSIISHNLYFLSSLWYHNTFFPNRYPLYIHFTERSNINLRLWGYGNGNYDMNQGIYNNFFFFKIFFYFLSLGCKALLDYRYSKISLKLHSEIPQIRFYSKVEKVLKTFFRHSIQAWREYLKKSFKECNGMISNSQNISSKTNL